LVTPTKYPKGLTWSPNMRNQFKITSWRTRAIGNLWPVDVPFGEVLRTQSFYLPGKTELLPKYEKGLKEGSVGRFFGPDSLDCITMPAPQTRVDSGCRRQRRQIAKLVSAASVGAGSGIADRLPLTRAVSARLVRRTSAYWEITISAVLRSEYVEGGRNGKMNLNR